MDLSYTLLRELTNNIQSDESITFSVGSYGLHIRRTAKNGDIRLDRIVPKIELDLSKFDMLGETLHDMALEIRKFVQEQRNLPKV